MTTPAAKPPAATTWRLTTAMSWRPPAAVAEDAAAVLFSLKCFAAAMLAYDIALSIGLNRPFWAVVTSYIIAQPLAGAVISKAAFRLVGTVLGGVAAVAIVPAFVNSPMLLALMLGLWLGLCIYIAQLDRTPRSYAFLLSGYTAMIIGLPAVTAPATVFDSAILRVQEITLGILCASFVHGVIFPVTVTARLAMRIDTILADTRSWAAASLTGTPDPVLDAARRQLATAVLELHQLSIHLPFDTARIVPRIRTVRALQDRLSLLLPLASAVEDRVAELRATPAGLAPRVATLLTRIRTWIETDAPGPDRGDTAAALIAAAAALEPVLDDAPCADLWHDMLTLNLLARLADLVAGLRDAHDLDAQLRTPSVRALSPHVAALLAATSGRPLHLDRAVAIRSGVATILTILIGSAFWIGTAWADGTGAVLIAGVVCALFGAVDNPGAAIGKMQLGSTIGLAIALVYAYAVFPRVTDFATLAAVLAPALLVMGVLIGKPALTPIGLGVLIGFPQSVGLYDRYEPNFAGSVNGAIAQFIGIGFAGIMLGLLVSVGAGRRAGALARAGWRDVARRARGEAPDTRRWSSRMLDRVGLMQPAAGTAPATAAPAATAMLDGLRDLRTGAVAGDLHALGQTAPPVERTLIAAALAGIDRHFRTLDPAAPVAPPPDLLAAIDTAARAFARDGDGPRRREGLILLASLRRNLFPAAGPCLTEAPA